MENTLITATQPRVRPDNVLANLSDDDQLQILIWLEEMTYAAAVAQIAKPRPEGLGLKTHVTSLRRFYARHNQEELEQNHDPAIWNETVEKIAANPINFRVVLMQALEREALMAVERISQNPNLAIQLLDRLLRFRALELKEQKAAKNAQRNDSNSLPKELLDLLAGNPGTEDDQRPAAKPIKQPLPFPQGKYTSQPTGRPATSGNSLPKPAQFQKAS
jgi:hypothetical protein